MVEKNDNLTEYAGKDQVLPFHVLQEKYKQKRSVVKYLTKYPTLDKHLGGGLALGELYVVSGETKNGKTLFLQSLTKNLEMQQANPLWFQFEVPPGQFFAQFPTLPTGFMPNELTPYSLPWIEERIKESYQKYNTRVVFIDHLHYLFNMAKTANVSLEIGALVRQLKRIAVVNEMIIFMACHTVKKDRNRVGAIDSSAIRDSSVITQESDCAIMINRGEDGEAQLFVDFHRRSGVWKKTVNVKKINGWLVEINDSTG